MDDKRVRFTAPVRRGLRQMLDRGLARHTETAIANSTAPHLRRNERLTAGEVAELRAAIAWIEQEAAAFEAEEVAA